jgi:TolA-binding protein
MRNGYKPAARGIGEVCVLGLALGLVGAAATMMAGCGGRNAGAPHGRTRTSAPTAAATPSTPSTPASAQLILDAGYQALENQQYNEAIAKAEEFLSKTPHGPGSAEALYLKGRSLEGKNAAGVSTDEAHKNLQEARAAYIEALEQMPQQPLESYIHASLGNVAYFQDDYQTAIAQLNSAYDKLDNDDIKAWALYRVGLSQQRLGQFAQADKTFATVQQLHPNSLPARRAREHQGARAFYVQLATFSSPAGADSAAADLHRQGVTAIRASDAQGRALLRVGPIASYSQAQFLRGRFSDKYPDAFIIP